jgi:mRNA interferase HigB
MKIHLINKELVEEFLKENPKHRSNLSTWLTAINHANWDCVSDMSETFGIFLLSKNDHQVVFNMAGLDCKIVCRYIFNSKRIHLFIKVVESNYEV